MILLSVGTQLPFDRLVRSVDQWAADHPEVEVIAQIGPSHYVPKAMFARDFFDPAQFRELQERCTLMVSHAGVGSIVNALELGKPIIILGRDHLRHEHRNGHQISTVEKFRTLPGIYVARDEFHLMELMNRKNLEGSASLLSADAPPEFLDYIRECVTNTHPKSFWRLLWRAVMKR